MFARNHWDHFRLSIDDDSFERTNKNIDRKINANVFNRAFVDLSHPEEAEKALEWFFDFSNDIETKEALEKLTEQNKFTLENICHNLDLDIEVIRKMALGRFLCSCQENSGSSQLHTLLDEMEIVLELPEPWNTEVVAAAALADYLEVRSLAQSSGKTVGGVYGVRQVGPKVVGTAAGLELD